MSACPPCRVCGKTEPVLVYSDDPPTAVCPDCCGESGHEWEHDRSERDWVCQHCGIARRYTDYRHGSDD
jgi:transposase